MAKTEIQEAKATLKIAKKEARESKKHYKFRSKLTKAIGFTLIGVTTLGGFFGYEALTDYEDFKNTFDNVIVIEQETASLNPLIAMPLLISALVAFFIIRKKNKDILKNKITLDVAIAAGISYLIYSVILIVLASLLGALPSVFAYEFIFTPISDKQKAAGLRQQEMNDECDKEVVRMKARKKAAEDMTNGSV